MQIKNSDFEMSPLRAQKKFINMIAEEFVYAKERKLKNYKKRVV